MSFTKVTNTGIGSTGTVLLQNLDVIGIVTAGFGVSTVDVFTTGITTFANATDSTSTTTGSVIVSGGVGIAGSLNVGGSVSVGGTLTYEDVTNVDSVGIITARSNILVGSGITLSPDGDVFATGVSTFIGNVHVQTVVGGENNRFLMGGKEVINVGGASNSGFFQIEGTSANSSSIALINNQNSTQSPSIRFGKSRGTGFGSTVSVADGDSLGKITFAGADGDDLENTTASIKVQVCNRYSGGATVGINSIPTDILFETSDTNNNSRQERLRITGDGKVGIGTTNPSTAFHVRHPTLNGVATFESGDAFCSISFRDINTSSTAPAIGVQGDTMRFVTYDGSASNERLRITGAGAIGLNGANYGTNNQAFTATGSGVEWRGVNTPCWFGRQDTVHNVGTGAWTTIINLGNSVVNPSANNGGWNESTGIFTVQSGQAGTYYVYGQAAIDDLMDNDVIRAGFSKNDGTVPLYSQQRCLDQGSNVIVNSGLVAQTVELAVGDTIKLQVYHNEGNSQNTEAIYTFFGGYRIST